MNVMKLNRENHQPFFAPLPQIKQRNKIATSLAPLRLCAIFYLYRLSKEIKIATSLAPLRLCAIFYLYRLNKEKKTAASIARYFIYTD
jgi:hypothetical protein